MARRTLDAPRYTGEGASRGTGSSAPKSAPKTKSQRRADRRFEEKQRAEQAPKQQRKRFNQEQKKAHRQNLRNASAGNPLAQLQRRSQLCSDQYVASLRKSGILAPGKGVGEQVEQMDDLHKAYSAMMVLQAVHPLQRGLTTQNIATTLTMSGALFAMSPNFRQMAKGYAGELKHMGQEVSDGVTRWRGNRAEKKLNKMADSLGTSDPSQLSGGRHQTAKMLQKRVDKRDYVDRGHREKFTEHSAALTEVGLAETAYYEMREPGVDPEAVMKQYDQLRSALYDDIEADGLDPDAVSKNMRLIVGQRVAKNPELAGVFSELAHSRMERSEPSEVYIEGTGIKVKAWNGDFTDAYNQGVVNGGSFSVRPPMDDLGHREAMARKMYSDMAHCQSPGDLDKVLHSYMLGSAVGEKPEAVDLIEDDAVRSSMANCRTMFNSMKDDGIDSKEGLMIYGASVLDAMRTVEQFHPEMAAQWQQSYGPNWDDVVKTKMAEYGDLGEQFANRPTRESSAEAFSVAADPIVPDAPKKNVQIEPVTIDAVEYERVDVSVVADYENKYAAYFGAHLDHAYREGGMEQFDAVAAELRLMNVRESETVTGEAIAGSQRAMAAEGLTSETQRAVYADGLVAAMQSSAQSHPEVAEQLSQRYGKGWENQQVWRIEDPDVFVAPEFGDAGEDQQLIARRFTHAMSESIAGDLAMAESQAPAEAGAGAVRMAMLEYTTSDSQIAGGVEDQQFHMRQANISRMYAEMDKAGLPKSLQSQIYAASVVNAAEQAADMSPHANKAAKAQFGEPWPMDKQRKAQVFAEIRGGEKTAAKDAEDDRDSWALEGMSISASAKEQTKAQLRQAPEATSDAAKVSEAAHNRSSRKAQRRRTNMAHNGHEVVSGRWEGQNTPDEGPELG